MAPSQVTMYFWSPLEQLGIYYARLVLRLCENFCNHSTLLPCNLEALPNNTGIHRCILLRISDFRTLLIKLAKIVNDVSFNNSALNCVSSAQLNSSHRPTKISNSAVQGLPGRDNSLNFCPPKPTNLKS